MSGNTEAHTLVMESITEALIQLMRKKPLSEIKVSELCEKAGVSRVSFYRNFDSIPQILTQRLSDITDAWWLDFSQNSAPYIQKNFWSALLEQYRSNRDMILLIYQNDLSYLIKEHIFHCCAVHETIPELEAYQRAALAGALYGIIDEWIWRGMGTIPEELSLRSMLHIFPAELQ